MLYCTRDGFFRSYCTRSSRSSDEVPEVGGGGDVGLAGLKGLAYGGVRFPYARYTLLRIGSKTNPARPCSACFPSPVMSHARPARGATFFSDGFLKMSRPGTVLAACKSGMLAVRPSSSCGVVMNS